MSASADHLAATAAAFDGQARAFERAPIQTDPRLLDGLARFADLPPGARVLDAGCGPGLVARALLDAPGDLRVLGCDLSEVMIERAAARCADAGDRIELVRASAEDVCADLAAGRRQPVDAVVSRLVLHHAPDPRAFVAAQVAALRPGGVLVLADHLADPEPDLAEWHVRLERMRDRSHAANLSGGALLDLLAGAGLEGLRYEEHRIATDFDEWFDRGTPAVSKEECRDWLMRPEGARSRAWRVVPEPDGALGLRGIVAFCRGVVP